jgi:hypothetical protein
MKRGCLITIIILVGLLALLVYGISTGFGPNYDEAKIKQNIGGTLICNSIYNADQHSWQYDITYKYRPDNDSTIEIGNGTYYSREWNKDEQLVRYNKWLILKTGGWIGHDKVIIYNLETKKSVSHDFTPEKIEKDSHWQNLKIHSLLDYCCSETFVDTISNGQIELHYKFRTNEKLTDKYDKRKIIYKIDKDTGQINLTKIE